MLVKLLECQEKRLVIPKVTDKEQDQLTLRYNTLKRLKNKNKNKILLLGYYIGCDNHLEARKFSFKITICF